MSDKATPRRGEEIDVEPAGPSTRSDGAGSTPRQDSDENGSGSAPITMAPGCPHGVQQTILAFGVLRGMAVMLGVGFGYPCPTYVPCLFAFEHRQMKKRLKCRD